MSALLTADEAARLHVGVNVIVRPGDPGRVRHVNIGQYVAPQDWVALTGPCPTCEHAYKKGSLLKLNERGRFYREPCPDCSDGRRIVPLYTECPNKARHLIDRLDCDLCDDDEKVQIATGSIEVVPVVDRDSPELCDRIVYLPPYINTPSTLWLVWRGQRHSTLTLDPLPVPGRDWGIVIDCVEVAP